MIALNPDGSELAAADENEILFLDPQTLQPARAALSVAVGQQLAACEYQPNGKALALRDSGSCILLDLETKKSTRFWLVTRVCS